MDTLSGLGAPGHDRALRRATAVGPALRVRPEREDPVRRTKTAPRRVARMTDAMEEQCGPRRPMTDRLMGTTAMLLNGRGRRPPRPPARPRTASHRPREEDGAERLRVDVGQPTGRHIVTVVGVPAQIRVPHTADPQVLVLVVLTGGREADPVVDLAELVQRTGRVLADEHDAVGVLQHPALDGLVAALHRVDKPSDADAFLCHSLCGLTSPHGRQSLAGRDIHLPDDLASSRLAAPVVRGTVRGHALTTPRLKAVATDTGLGRTR
ncbi:hypothetical protein SAVIM40S_07417 [Streptomyces avidinii]